MKKALLRRRSGVSPETWDFKPVWLIKEHKNSWRIWDSKNIFSRLVLKNSYNEKIEEL